MHENSYMITPVGVVRSTLSDPGQAPLQGDEGQQDAWLVLEPEMAEALAGLAVGDALIVLTWLHLAQRDVLQVRPRNRADAPLTGVFATRSQDRPNPIGLHPVVVLAISGPRVQVAPIEAVDGTPIVDIKPVLGSVSQR